MAGGTIQLTEGRFYGGTLTVDATSFYRVTLRGQGYGQVGCTTGRGATAYNLAGVTDTINVLAGGRLQNLEVVAPASFTGNAVTVGSDTISLVSNLLSDLLIWGPNEFTGTGLLLQGIANGADEYVQICHFGSINIWAFEYGLRMYGEGVTHDGFVNGNIFDSLMLYRNNYGIEQEMVGAKGSVSGNQFTSVQIQADTGTLRGIHISRSTHYNMVMAWDWATLAAAGKPALLIDAGVTRSYIAGELPLVIDNSTPGANVVINFSENLVNLPTTDKNLVWPLANLLVQDTSLTGADIILPFKDGSGTVVTDISGNRDDATLVAAPTWSTMGQLGSVVLNGTTQYAKTPVIDLTGDRTFILVFSPNDTDAALGSCYLMDWYLNATNRIDLQWALGSRTLAYTYREPVGGGHTATVSMPRHTPFVADDVLVVILTADVSVAVYSMYINGRFASSSSTVAGRDVDAGTAEIVLGADKDYANFAELAGLSFFAELPRSMEAAEIANLSNMLGHITAVTNYREKQTETFVVDAFEYPAPGTDWTPTLNGAYLGASLSAKKVWLPLNFLKHGDEIVSYRLVGDAVEAAALTLDAKVVKINKADPPTTTDLANGAITQVDADGNFDSLATLLEPGTGGLVVTDSAYKLEILGTTGAGDSITVFHAEVTIHRVS